LQLTPTHYVVLNLAIDESSLWALTWGAHTYDRAGKLVEILPRLARDDARAALRDLVASYTVELYEQASLRTLPLPDALAAIDDDANWLVPAESGREIWYAVVVSETGYETYNQAHSMFGKQFSG